MASGEFRRVHSDNMAKALHGSLAVFIYPSLLEHEINDDNNGSGQDRLEADLDQLLDLLLHGLCSGEK